jgi:glycerophosphoryl diester phosphodiesterase
MKLILAPAIVVVSFLASACAPEAIEERPLIVAHRGASDLAPENTLAAFDLAWELGADTIEGDFHLTRDGSIVAHHDESTQRTAGLDVPVEQQTLAELKELDVGSWKDARWAGERIPTLEEVLETVPAHGRILIEVKSGTEIMPGLAGVIERSTLPPDRLVIISFDESVIAAAREQLPYIRRYWVCGFDEAPGGGWTPLPEHIIETARRIGADGVDLEANREVLDEPFARKLAAAGLELHVWTVNDADLARRMIDLGVHSITTDRPGWLRTQIDGGD